MKKKNNKSSFGSDLFEILTDPNEPLINYRGIKYSSKNDIIRYKNQHYVNNYMKWINVQAFKLYYDKKVYVQCLYIKNANAINKREILLFSQSLRTNFATCLAFLIDLSNYLKIDIITYEYNKKDNEDMNYFDANIVYGYLNQLERIRNIVLLGLSVGNKINMNIALSKNNLYPKNKLKAIILLSPTWIYNLEDLKNLKNSINIKGDVDKFIKNVNLYNIPVFIIHGKKDTKVKYFLSLSFSQQIKNKTEWFPKNGTHLGIINEHRAKLLIRIKQFLLMNNFLKKNEKDLLLKIKFNYLDESGFEDDKRETIKFNIDYVSFDNKKNEDNDEDFFGYYNYNDLLGIQKKNIIVNREKSNSNYNNKKQKIKNDDELIINPTFETENDNDIITNTQTFKNVDYSIGGNLLDVSENADDNNILKENENKMDVSFLPDDSKPNSIDKTNTYKSFDIKKNLDDASFMSFK